MLAYKLNFTKGEIYHGTGKENQTFLEEKIKYKINIGVKKGF